MGTATSRELGYFDLDERYVAPSTSGDPLERLSSVIDVDLFRAPLSQVLHRSDSSLSALPTSHRVPDYAKIWRFREALVTAGAIDNLLAHLDRILARSKGTAQGYQYTPRRSPDRRSSGN